MTRDHTFKKLHPDIARRSREAMRRHRHPIDRRAAVEAFAAYVDLVNAGHFLAANTPRRLLLGMGVQVVWKPGLARCEGSAGAVQKRNGPEVPAPGPPHDSSPGAPTTPGTARRTAPSGEAPYSHEF